MEPQSTQKIPNFIIGGAPKAGTTSLHNWLAQHPEVFGTPAKETYFLEDAESHMFKAKENIQSLGKQAYSRYFEAAKEQHKVVFESTPNYLYQETALDYFRENNPQAKVAFSLRNPADRVLSQYNYNVYTLGKFSKNTKLKDFIDLGMACSETYIEVEGHRLLNPIESNKYLQYLKPWYQAMSEGSIIIINFDKLKNHPREVLKGLSNQLGIDASFWNEFKLKRSNSSKYNRSKKLFHLLNKVEKAESGLNKYTRRLHKLNTLRKPKITDEERKLLLDIDQYFKSWNTELAEYCGLDLSNWRFKK